MVRDAGYSGIGERCAWRTLSLLLGEHEFVNSLLKLASVKSNVRVDHSKPSEKIGRPTSGSSALKPPGRCFNMVRIPPAWLVRGVTCKIGQVWMNPRSGKANGLCVCICKPLECSLPSLQASVRKPLV